MINQHFDADIYGVADLLAMTSLYGAFEDDADGSYLAACGELARLWARRPAGWRFSMEALVGDVLGRALRARVRPPAAGPLRGAHRTHKPASSGQDPASVARPWDRA